MIYCINPHCENRQNNQESTICQSCGNILLINSQYQLLKPLRHLNITSDTEIFEAKDIKTEQNYVIKILKRNNIESVERFKNEARILQILDYESIPQVKLDGYFTFKLNKHKTLLHCIVIEKIEGENLEQWLTQNDPINEKQAINWLNQLFKILSYLHSNHNNHL